MSRVRRGGRPRGPLGPVGGRLALGLLAASAIASWPSGAMAQRVSVQGEAGLSTRLFPNSPLFGEQAGARVSPSLTFAPEILLESEDGVWSLRGEGFFRLDAHDGNRTHMDVRELGAQYAAGPLRVFAGMGQVFWGVTEARHLVDVVNQVDAVEDVDGEDKLGQPMLLVTLEGGWGALDLFYLPYFRERSFPAVDARLRGPLPIEPRSVYVSGQGRWHPGFAARAFRTVGSLDVGVSAFRGTSREPRLVPGAVEPAGLVAHYDLIDQLGVDVQWTGERTLLKLEAMTRGGHGDRMHAVAAGVERSVYQVFGSDGDLGLLGELMLDSREEGAPPTVFDHDVFLGARWALNDVSDTSVLGGPIVDLHTGEIIGLVEVDRRVGSDWRVQAEARLFGNTDPGSAAYGLRNDGFFSISLRRFF